jgi:hypothetical protein
MNAIAKSSTLVKKEMREVLTLTDKERLIKKGIIRY